MQNKKVTMLAMTALSMGAFALTLFFVTHKSVTPVAENNCPYASDQEAYAAVIEAADEKICTCIQEEDLKITCLDVASDSGFYKKALSNLNADICDNIKDQTSRESCALAVKDGMENAAVDPGLTPEKKPMMTVDYEQIQKESPLDVVNLINLAMAYGAESFSGGDGKIDAIKINKALATLEEAKKIEPNNANIYATEGYINNLNLQNNQALAAYGKSLALAANNDEALLGRARVYIYLEKLPEAIADLEKAASLDPAKNNNEIYLSLCSLYAQNANREKAVENCNIIINGKNDESLKTMARESLNSIK